jgi:hypothetical protein
MKGTNVSLVWEVLISELGPPGYYNLKSNIPYMTGEDVLKNLSIQPGKS